MYIEEMLNQYGLESKMFDARKGEIEDVGGDDKADQAPDNIDSLWANYDKEDGDDFGNGEKEDFSDDRDF